MALATRFKTQVNGLRQKSDLLGTPPESPDGWFAKFLHLNSRKEKKGPRGILAKRTREYELEVPAQRTDSATATVEASDVRFELPQELPGSEWSTSERHPQLPNGQPIADHETLVSSPYVAHQPQGRPVPSHDEDAPAPLLHEVDYPNLEPESDINDLQTSDDARSPLASETGRYEPSGSTERTKLSSGSELDTNLGYRTFSYLEQPDQIVDTVTKPSLSGPGPSDIEVPPVTSSRSSGALAENDVQQSAGSGLQTLAEEVESDGYVRSWYPARAAQSDGQPAGTQRKYKNPMNPYNRFMSAPSSAHAQKADGDDLSPSGYLGSGKRSVVEPLGPIRRNDTDSPLAIQADRLLEQAGPEAQLSEAQREDVKLFNTRVGPYVRSIVRHNVKGLGYGRYVRADLELARTALFDRRQTRQSIIVITHSGLTTRQVKDIETLFSKPERTRGLQGFNWIVRESNAFGFRGSRRAFSNTAVWGLKTEPMMEIALPRHRRTLCGAPVQAIPDPDLENPYPASWTCGGLVLVDGVMFCLTTAHPLIVPLESHDKDEANDGIEPDPSLWNPWQTAGLVNQFALSHRGDVPDNCDWLLFELAREHQLPNMSARGKAGEAEGTPWTRLPLNQNDPEPEYPSCHIHTSHGVVSATVNPGYSFIVTGESAFDTIRLSHLDRKLDKGDSGAWITRSGELIGILIAADDTAPASAFAIRIEDVIASISKGMGDAIVELPSAIDNEILDHLGNDNKEDPAYLRHLIHLYITKALQSKDDPQYKLRHLETFGRQALFPGLASYIQIGKLVQVPTERVQNTLHRHRYNPLEPLTTGHRTAARLAKAYHGQCFLAFVAWFSLNCREGMTLHGTIDYLTLLIEGLFQEIEADPTCIPSTNEIRRLIKDVAFGWPISLRIYSMLRISSPRFPLEVTVPEGVPPPHIGARLLVRLLTFDRKRCFFVYRGPFARWLSKFADPLDDFNSSSDFGMRTRKGIPRAFLNSDHSESAGYEVYGKIVQYPELEDALQRQLRKELGTEGAKVKGSDKKGGDEKRGIRRISV